MSIAITLNWVAAFVALYFAWAQTSGLTTAAYGPQAWKSFSDQNGRIRDIVCAIPRGAIHWFKWTAIDLRHVLPAAWARLRRRSYHWPDDGVRIDAEEAYVRVLAGIAFRGMITVVIPLYWALLNPAWTDVSLRLAVPFAATVGYLFTDTVHQLANGGKWRRIVRINVFLCTSYVLVPLFFWPL